MNRDIYIEVYTQIDINIDIHIDTDVEIDIDIRINADVQIDTDVHIDTEVMDMKIPMKYTCILKYIWSLLFRRMKLAMTPFTLSFPPFKKRIIRVG